MARSDRLHALIETLGDGALHRSADLARALGVSQRTLFRDIDALRASGIPVQGTRGAGYRVTAPVTLPPLNLTLSELEALHLGLAVVAEAADAELGQSAQSLADKLDAALPEPGAPSAPRGLATYPFTDSTSGFRHLPALRTAVRTRQKVRAAEAGGTPVTLRPLGLDYRGRLWLLVAWSEDDGNFRTVRVDRIDGLEILPELFADEAGKRLTDFHGL